jgi:type IV pilus assembly protein PilB
MATTPYRQQHLGAGLRLAGTPTPSRLDHTFFENEVRPMLGSILLRKGWITPERLDAALAEGRRTGMRLGEILLSHSWLFEPELAAALAEQFDVPYVDLAVRSIDPAAAGLMPLEVARRMFAVPVRFVDDDRIQVAVADPGDADVEALERILGCSVELAVGERSAIQGCWITLRH